MGKFYAEFRIHLDILLSGSIALYDFQVKKMQILYIV